MSPFAFGLLTVSDTRRDEDDASGRILRDLATEAGHTVRAAAIVPDEPDALRERIETWVADPGCEVIVSSGGTGFSPRDRTVETVGALFTTPIEGFGEIFRMLSFEEVGSAAMLTRACAGLIGATPVFLLPGSPRAVRLGMSRLILPEIGHILTEIRRRGAPHA